MSAAFLGVWVIYKTSASVNKYAVTSVRETLGFFRGQNTISPRDWWGRCWNVVFVIINTTWESTGNAPTWVKSRREACRFLATWAWLPICTNEGFWHWWTSQRIDTCRELITWCSLLPENACVLCRTLASYLLAPSNLFLFWDRANGKADAWNAENWTAHE